MLSRRHLLFGFSATLLASSVGAQGAPRIHVIKGRGCGCCTAWSDILKAEGFLVTEEEMLPGDLTQVKLRKGIPAHLASCHTAEIEGYAIEGHVPVADIKRLLAEKPDAVGLSVPGMPYGSPGMGPENEREAYDVLLVRRGGSSEVFTSYEAADA